MPEMYKTLNDAALPPANQTVLAPGKTKIWYFKAGLGRDYMMGLRWLKQSGLAPTRATLEQTHTLLGEVVGTNLDELYNALQGEVWSPEGQARELIIRKGLKHTTICVGDIIEIDNTLFFVESYGFENLE